MTRKEIEAFEAHARRVETGAYFFVRTAAVLFLALLMGAFVAIYTAVAGGGDDHALIVLLIILALSRGSKQITDHVKKAFDK